MVKLISFSLQINEKGKTGEVNAGYDDEKAATEVKSGNGKQEAGGQEPWMNNYVPYGKNPSGNPIEQVMTPWPLDFDIICLSATDVSLTFLSR